MYSKDGENYFIVDAHIALWDARPGEPAQHPRQAVHRLLLRLPPQPQPRSPRCGPYEEYLYQGGERLMKDLFEDGYVDHAIFQPAYLGEFYTTGLRADRGGVRARPGPPGQADLQPQLRPAQRRGGPRPAARGRRAVRAQGREALHRRVARRLPRLEARRPVGATATSRSAASSASPTSTSTRARRSGRWTATPSTSPTSTTWPPTSPTSTSSSSTVGLPRLEDFCWIATQEPNVHARPGRRDAVHPHPAAVLRADHRRAPLLDRRGPDPVLLRLRDLDAEVAGREVRGLPDPRGHDGVRARSRPRRRRRSSG